jgi:chromate transporter
MPSARFKCYHVYQIDKSAAHFYDEANFSERTGGMNAYLDLFLTFARVGGLTFGGGYAMLPILQREVVEKRGWVSEEDVMDFYAISQCLPGIIAVNTSLFIGNKLKGVKGSIAAALGVVFPSLVIIILIAAFLRNFTDVESCGNAFAGIHVCVFVLILNSVWKLCKGAMVDVPALIIFAAVFLLSAFHGLLPHPDGAASAALAGVCGKARNVWRESGMIYFQLFL